MAQTTAEFLIEQGMQLGIEQGKTEGKAEGKAEGKVEIHNHEHLDILLEQAMTAQSLEEDTLLKVSLIRGF